MKRLGLVLAVWALSAMSAQAQTIYNPSGLTFTHPDFGITTEYILELYDPGDETTPIFTTRIPKDRIRPEGTEYALDRKWMPMVPVGKSYKARLRAANGDGTSEPSNITPQSWRLSPCAAPGAGVVTSPVVTVGPLPATLPRNTLIELPVNVFSASNVVSIRVDLWGDGQPGWYYVMDDGRPALTVLWGPLTRAGRFELTVALVDAQGCEATLGTRTWITVQ